MACRGSYIPAGTVTVPLPPSTGLDAVSSSSSTQWDDLTHTVISSLQSQGPPTKQLLQHAASLIRSRWALFDYWREGLRLVLRVYLKPMDETPNAQSKRCERAMRELIYQHLSNKKDSWENPRQVYSSGSVGIRGLEDALDVSQTLQKVYQALESPEIEHLTEEASPPENKLYCDFVQSPMILGIRTPPYAYQKKGISKMLRRELTRGTINHPDVLQCTAVDGSCYFLEKTSGIVRRFLRDDEDSFRDVRGGICCEDMGNGKTYMMLSLIAATRYQLATPSRQDSTIKDRNTELLKYDVSPFIRDCYETQSPDTEFDPSSKPLPLMALAARAVLKCMPLSLCKSKLPRQIYKRLEQCETFFVRQIQASNRPMRNARTMKEFKIHTSSCSFVIVPETLVDQWISEFNKHVSDSALRMLVIKDDHVIPDEGILKRYQIILMGYNRFMKEDEKGGFDFLGIPRVCRCPYIGSTRGKDCQCDGLSHGPEQLRYESPLVKIHALRLIIDEGHVVSDKHSRVVRMAKKLSVERRWICTGTPLPNMAVLAKEREIVEKLDLERLAGILDFLELRPYCDVPIKGIKGCFRDVILRPVLNKSTRGYALLQTLLNDMMIRSRPEVVERDVTLPPLYERVVRLNMTRLQRETYNYYLAMVALNAILSQREHQDFLLHPQNRRHRRIIIDNIIQSSFWRPVSGVDGIIQDLDAAIENGQDGLQQAETRGFSPADIELLKRTVDLLLQARHDSSFVVQQSPAEVMYYVQHWPIGLDNCATFAVPDMKDVVMVGGDAVEEVRRYYNSLDEKGIVVTQEEGKDADSVADRLPRLLFHSPCGTPRSTTASMSSSPSSSSSSFSISNSGHLTHQIHPPDQSETEEARLATKLISTASSKLTYLAECIMQHSVADKIIIYTDVHNEIAFLHQICRMARIPCLLYHRRGMSVDERSKNIALFQTAEFVRVMIMDIRVGAYGIDLSSACRVYFTSPVWAPDVERQALKRAHRIGCHKPVHVETLVARGSIEEDVLNIRTDVSSQVKQKTIYDDGIRHKLLQIFKYIENDDNNEAGNADGVQLLSEPITAFPKLSPRHRDEPDIIDPLQTYDGVTDLYDPDVPLVNMRATWVNSKNREDSSDDEFDDVMDSTCYPDTVDGASSGNIDIAHNHPNVVKPGQMYLVGGAHADSTAKPVKSPRKRQHQNTHRHQIPGGISKRRRLMAPLRSLRKKNKCGSSRTIDMGNGMNSVTEKNAAENGEATEANVCSGNVIQQDLSANVNVMCASGGPKRVRFADTDTKVRETRPSRDVR
ncbi:hypothetical protein SeLEV6574_g06553 [Synchytrium endobioticum]|uniref:Helicase C-terminal domain-containing protein n=1 Tax=Synchytrium endobioticum TaxID=286115 RepID=A0A507CN56_9FUNG|nr:hypothetical protein SeLEV6574_g06553 [Synchytrium endobioticum]